MFVEVHPARLRGAANSIRSNVATSDMRHRFAGYRVGEIDGWRSLYAFKTAASAFAGIMSEQLGFIANSFTLGANDASDADLIEVDAEGGGVAEDEGGWDDGPAHFVISCNAGFAIEQRV